jgi:uncharacterized protein (DUF2344 family)
MDAEFNIDDVVYRYEKVFNQAGDVTDIRVKRSVVTSVILPTGPTDIYLYCVDYTDKEYAEIDLWVDMAEMVAYLLKDLNCRLEAQQTWIEKAEAEVANLKKQKRNTENVIKILNIYV